VRESAIMSWDVSSRRTESGKVAADHLKNVNITLTLGTAPIYTVFFPLFPYTFECN
jgi:hypothetical protein